MFPFSLAWHFACLFLAGASAERLATGVTASSAWPCPRRSAEAWEIGFTLDFADQAGPALKVCQASWILLGEAFQSKAFFWD